MNGAISVDVRGIPEVQAALGKLEGPAMKRTLQKATSAGAKVLKPYVQREAPRRTGRLRRSVSARQAKRDRPASIVSPRSKIAFYRHFVIRGTGAPGPTKANPFVARGYDRGKAEAEKAVEKVVEDYLASL